jgi:carbamoyl-phosphate synthase large subunit
VRGGFRVPETIDDTELRRRLVVPSAERIYFTLHALTVGYSVETVHELTKIDLWFLDNLKEIVEREQQLSGKALASLSRDEFYSAKQMGFSDLRLAALLQGNGSASATENEVRSRRLELGVRPVFKRVDTCGAEFESFTPYLYSSYEAEDEAAVTDRKKIIILGSGPNRIGQGIEFDYCCCHAAFALG